MSHGNVIRRTLAFPSLTAGGASASAAIPDPRSSALPYVIASDDAGTLDPAALSSYQDAARMLDIPQGTVAISIAPDSLIHSCDISFSGSPEQAVRLSPGLPIVGCRGEIRALVTLPTMPYGVAITGASAIAGMAGTYPDDGQDVAQWPLRLEFWTGDVVHLRHHRRAPMIVNARVVTSLATDRLVYACVDGRRQISLTVSPTTADVAVTVTGVPGIPIALDDLGTLTATVTAGTDEVFTFQSAAPTFSLIQVRIDGAGAGTCYVEIRAED